MPPTTATANGPLVSAPAPIPTDTGSIVRMTVNEVIKIGRKRNGQASSSASRMPIPRARI